MVIKSIKHWFMFVLIFTIAFPSFSPAYAQESGQCGLTAESNTLENDIKIFYF